MIGMGHGRYMRRQANKSHRDIVDSADKAWDEYYRDEYGTPAPAEHQPARRSINAFFDALGG